MKEGTKNLTASDLANMENYPSRKANEIGSRIPYHLQYLRDGKPNVKPEVKSGKAISDK